MCLPNILASQSTKHLSSSSTASLPNIYIATTIQTTDDNCIMPFAVVVLWHSSSSSPHVEWTLKQMCPFSTANIYIESNGIYSVDDRRNALGNCHWCWGFGCKAYMKGHARFTSWSDRRSIMYGLAESRCFWCGLISQGVMYGIGGAMVVCDSDTLRIVKKVALCV